MTSETVADEPVQERSLTRLYHKLGQGTFARLTTEDAKKLQAIIREVRRHRKLEHDNFWGEDDE